MKLQTSLDSQNLNSEKRPWGSFKEIYKNELINVKVIKVNPKSKLSLQSHKKREEHWIIEQGYARVTLNKEKIYLEKGQQVHIPQGAIHRLENIHHTDQLVVIEIQQGSYFGEDDITRYEDDYNRA